MGSTCASVHIALTGAIPDAIDGIVRAYRTLGFEPAETASPAGGKHVILLRKEGDAFLSVYDSDNAALDTGELQDLARAASKIFKTAAVCTSLYDSDTFEVVVFNAGRQVDLVVPDPEGYSPSQETERRIPGRAMEQDRRRRRVIASDRPDGRAVAASLPGPS
jgi:hypothetical protein